MRLAADVESSGNMPDSSDLQREAADAPEFERSGVGRFLKPWPDT